MKLDDINLTKKKKSKKGIIIGTSTIAVLTLTGICGWNLIKDVDGDSMKIAQSLVSGPVLQRAFSDSEGKDDEGGLPVKPDIVPDRVLQLEDYLSALGFGYSKMTGLSGYGDIDSNYEFQSEKDGTDGFIYLDSLYCLYKGIDSNADKPKYAKEPDEKPEIQFKVETEEVPGAGVIYIVTAYYWQYGTQNAIYSKPVNNIISLDDAKKEAVESIKEDFDKEVEKYEKAKKEYDEWAKYRKERNDWIVQMSEAGFFDKKEPGKEYSQYTQFWAGIAQKALGKDAIGSDVGDFSGESINNLVDLLYAQLFDVDGELIENAPNNLLQDILHWQNDGSIEEDAPMLNPANPEGSQSVVNPDMSGGEIPGITGGGGSGGGSGGGGGETGGGSGGGGETDGGDTSEESKLEAKSVTIMSPRTNVYKAGQEIKLKVTFNEEVFGTDKKVAITKDNAPKFYISFIEEIPKGETETSNIQNKQATFESVSGKNIVYTYKIADGDNGRLSLGTGNNLIGTVYDSKGRKVELTKVGLMNETPVVVADNKSPFVTSIESISPEKTYNTGEKIEIKVIFNEKVYSNESKVTLLLKTVPILNISFGDGEIKNPEIKTINNVENYLIYTYTIQAEDRGTLKIDPLKAFDGTKNIYDIVGNGTVLVAGVPLTGNAISANADLATITLNKTDLTLDLKDKQEETLTATTKPEGLEITWSVADDKVATVDSKTGKVTAVAVGETTITAKASDGTTATCKVTVKDTTKGETKITLNKTTLELDLSGTKEEQLKATVKPEELAVTWASSNIKIAKVDSKTGKVTAVGEGTATITAKALDGTTATCKVTVKNSKPQDIEPTAVEFVTVNPTIAMNRTETLKMEARVIPSNSNKNTGLTFESSDEKIATIDEKGNVTIKGVGTTVISVTTENGKSAYTNLTVTEIKDNKKVLGDATEDGKIDSSDLLAILRHIAVTSSSETKAKHQDWLIEGDTYVTADIDGNGRVDITDALGIQRHIAYDKSETVKQKHPDWQIKSNWTN